MAVRSIRVGAVNLHVVDEGTGQPVLLLHGFPDSSRLWRHQIPALTAAGYRIIVPDLRGFGQSDRPTEVEAYALTTILGDVIGILDQLGVDKTHVVAHDWGAALGWLMASIRPERVDRYAALSVGHPNGWPAAGLEQCEKSWYMLLFQFHDVAEQLIQRDDWHWLRTFTRQHSEIDQWVDDLRRPGALSAGLAWYRANASFAPERLLAPPPNLPKVTAPTLGLWSSGDAYLTEAQMLHSADWMAGPWRYERVEGASHWLQLDRPDRINELLLGFLKT